MTEPFAGWAAASAAALDAAAALAAASAAARDAAARDAASAARRDSAADSSRDCRTDSSTDTSIERDSAIEAARDSLASPAARIDSSSRRFASAFDSATDCSSEIDASMLSRIALLRELSAAKTLEAAAAGSRSRFPGPPLCLFPGSSRNAPAARNPFRNGMRSFSGSGGVRLIADLPMFHHPITSQTWNAPLKQGCAYSTSLKLYCSQYSDIYNDRIRFFGLFDIRFSLTEKRLIKFNVFRSGMVPAVIAAHASFLKFFPHIRMVLVIV